MYVNVTNAANRLGLSKSEVEILASRGALPAVRRGGRSELLFLSEDLDSFFEGCKTWDCKESKLSDSGNGTAAPTKWRSKKP